MFLLIWNLHLHTQFTSQYPEWLLFSMLHFPLNPRWMLYCWDGQSSRNITLFLGNGLNISNRKTIPIWESNKPPHIFLKIKWSRFASKDHNPSKLYTAVFFPVTRHPDLITRAKLSDKSFVSENYNWTRPINASAHLHSVTKTLDQQYPFGRHYFRSQKSRRRF